MIGEQLIANGVHKTETGIGIGNVTANPESETATLTATENARES